MEIEQLIKKIEWLDEERRKDKNAISSLEDKLSHTEANIQTIKKGIKSLQTELSSYDGVYGRMDQIDESLSQVKVEIGRMAESFQKSRLDSEYEQEKKRRDEIDGINKTIVDLRKSITDIPTLKNNIAQVQSVYQNIENQLINIDQKVSNFQITNEEFVRSQKSIEESRKVDNKRVTDMQGEVTAYRKRIDEHRGKLELLTENIKKLDTRVNSVIQSETDRKVSQVGFIEKQNQTQVERDRQWKEMQSRFDKVEEVSASVDHQLQALDETLRTIRRSKEQLDESTARIDRRVNEITEMHRLNEDHFRQEWTSYKAEEQKRWANYSLVQEENNNDLNRQYKSLETRLVELEDLTRKVNEEFGEFSEETGNRLRNLLDMTHSWLSVFERKSGSS